MTLTKKWFIDERHRPPLDPKKDRLWPYRDKSLNKSIEDVEADDVLEELMAED